MVGEERNEVMLMVDEKDVILKTAEEMAKDQREIAVS